MPRATSSSTAPMRVSTLQWRSMFSARTLQYKMHVMRCSPSADLRAPLPPMGLANGSIDRRRTPGIRRDTRRRLRQVASIFGAEEVRQTPVCGQLEHHEYLVWSGSGADVLDHILVVELPVSTSSLEVAQKPQPHRSYLRATTSLNIGFSRRRAESRVLVNTLTATDRSL